MSALTANCDFVVIRVQSSQWIHSVYTRLNTEASQDVTGMCNAALHSRLLALCLDAGALQCLQWEDE